MYISCVMLPRPSRVVLSKSESVGRACISPWTETTRGRTWLLEVMLECYGRIEQRPIGNRAREAPL